MTPSNHCQKTTGFTLVEVLVVISIIALLVSLLLPAIGAARSAAMATICGTQIKGLSTAGFNYAADNREVFCGPYTGNEGVDNTSLRRIAGKDIWGIVGWNGLTPGDPGYATYAPPGNNGGLGFGAMIINPSNPASGYAPVELATCPSLKNAGNPNWHARRWFGEPWAAAWTALGKDPEIAATDSPWWSSPVFGNFYLQSSYSFRCGDWAKYDIVSDSWVSTFFADYNRPGVGGTHAANTKTSAPTFNNRCQFAEVLGTNHGQSIGGNVGWGDGSVSYCKDAKYIHGDYSSGSVGVPNVWAGDNWNSHWLSMLHAAMDSIYEKW